MEKNKIQCFFCVNNREPDYKDAEVLKKFISVQAKIWTRKKSKLCAYHQRKFAKALKRGRYLALVPYTTR
ncbi:MAG: 30S ribosomal protein S18 [bacterium]|nr:30S ribosomal protein S18 [bacterium]